jgi:hypothetical protein
MTAVAMIILATFTTPENIGTTPQSVLWLLPLTAAIAVVYKATKLRTIKAGDFVKETTILFGSIIVFISVTAFVLFALAWLITA